MTWNINPICNVHNVCVGAVSPSSPELLPSVPLESPAQRYEARTDEGKLYYDKRW